MGEIDNLKDDLGQIARLALAEETDDIRLFVARLVRKYRNIDPEVSEKLNTLLQKKNHRSSTPMRKAHQFTSESQTLPVDDDSKLALLRNDPDIYVNKRPILSRAVEEVLNRLIAERRQADQLAKMGLSPTKSAIFLGPPGVGKTLTARWLAMQLNLPLYILDLTAVMSSFLGKTGTNLRAVLDYAKNKPCVLLLDEIDAIAKRRSDDTDVGELKRLVTVILQEVEYWPAAGVLLAATNHPEIIDHALWRRFDLVIEFGLPDKGAIKAAIKNFFADNYVLFERWSDLLAFAFDGDSFSDIERTIQSFRRSIILGIASAQELVEDFIKTKALKLNKRDNIELSLLLAKHTKLSQHTISNITGISRDTIRKYRKATMKGGLKSGAD